MEPERAGRARRRGGRGCARRHEPEGPKHDDGRGDARRRGRARRARSASAALARTIHDAKGENLTAVLVVARDEDAVLLANGAWTETPPDETVETTRVAYVAFTRAERLLVIAIPSDTADDVVEKIRAVGFTEPTESRARPST